MNVIEQIINKHGVILAIGDRVQDPIDHGNIRTIGSFSDGEPEWVINMDDSGFMNADEITAGAKIWLPSEIIPQSVHDKIAWDRAFDNLSSTDRDHLAESSITSRGGMIRTLKWQAECDATNRAKHGDGFFRACDHCSSIARTMGISA